MISTTARRTLSASALVVAGMFAGMQTADAGPYRVRFDPLYGAPFTGLGWQGEAFFDEGECTKVGSVNNFPYVPATTIFGIPVGNPLGCGGELTLTGAFVDFYKIVGGEEILLETITFTGGQVVTAEIPGPGLGVKPTAFVSTPFDPVQADNPLTQYFGDYGYGNGSQAWFSLVFTGEFAQLYWFKKDPGDFSLWTASTYAHCFKAGSGETPVGRNVCGLSEGNGAPLVISYIPEPESYALVLAGLGGLAFFTRRRSLKS